MSYHPMRFDPAYRPFVAPESIYILPLGEDPAAYRVLSPSTLDRKLIDVALQGRLSIRTFEGCPVDAFLLVREQLARRCARQAERYGSRLNQLAVAGGALAVLGLINWVLPDPIPLADEVLLTFGGAGLAYYGFSQRKKSLPGLRLKVEAAERQLEALAPVRDPFLDRIHRAIRARSSPPGALSAGGGQDPVEAESAWLVEHLDLDSTLQDGDAARADLRRLIEVLEAAFPLRRIGVLERRLRRHPSDRYSRRAAQHLARRAGMSRDAATVYAEFHRAAREILDE
jgi:hypothetical protein